MKNFRYFLIVVFGLVVSLVLVQEPVVLAQEPTAVYHVDFSEGKFDLPSGEGIVIIENIHLIAGTDIPSELLVTADLTQTVISGAVVCTALPGETGPACWKNGSWTSVFSQVQYRPDRVTQSLTLLIQNPNGNASLNWKPLWERCWKKVYLPMVFR